MNENKIIKSFTTIGFGVIVSMAIGAVTTPILTRLVEPSQYGRLSIFIMYSNLAMNIFCLGQDQSLMRYFYENSEINYRSGLLNKCICWPIILTIIAIIIITILHSIGMIFKDFNGIEIAMLCILSFEMVIYRFTQLTVRLLYQSKLYSALNIIQKISYVAIGISLLFIFHLREASLLVVATIISYGICIVTVLFINRDLWRIRNTYNCPIKSSELIRYGLPFVISASLTSIFSAIDKLSLQYFCTYDEVGLYSSAISIISLFAVFQTTFCSLWMPMAVEHYSQKPDDKSLYEKGNGIITVIMMTVGIGLILCKDILALLLGPKYRMVSCIFPFLVFNPIMYTISETTVVGLFLKNKGNMQVVVAAVSCIANLIGNVALVPKLGCRGAAISTGVAYVVFFTLRTFLSKKYFKVNYNLKSFYCLIILVVIFALYSTFYKTTCISVILAAICMIALCVMYKNSVNDITNYIKKIILK